MRVKITTDYNDTQLKRAVKADEELDVTDARGKKLLEAKVAVEIAEPVAEKPAKGRKKKEEA